MVLSECGDKVAALKAPTLSAHSEKKGRLAGGLFERMERRSVSGDCGDRADGAGDQAEGLVEAFVD